MPLVAERVSGPLIATASAFDFYEIRLSTFTRRELYLLYPDFIDPAAGAGSLVSGGVYCQAKYYSLRFCQ